MRKLDGTVLAHFRSVFDEEFWRNIPAAAGALEACEILKGMGLNLACVTAMEPHFQTARTHNVQILGFPIHQLIANAGTVDGYNPKAAVLNALKPVAYVDDFAPYLTGVAPGTHLALVDRDPIGSPNTGHLQQEPHSRHPDLLTFAWWWKRKSSL